ncbi:MAG TPA: PAS domain S-box protein [Oscillatoriaceae cyanobacterium M33_DOE_052]|uniref:histidine kinase n=1 Tax=Planktothricoides sp. SpSt-374 TaxID=2282167 RepID=A0A7C3VRV1_9CYAN|nr:PAS domain S-box protein [Oscillatoriaceae cyanobacterium M33_DOE_052]
MLQIQPAWETTKRRSSKILAEGVPVGIFHTDAKGTCLYVNDCWCKLTGLTPKEALGQGWHKGIHPDDRERVLEAWNLALQANQPFNSEYRWVRADGSIAWALTQAVGEIGEDRRVRGWIGTAVDITERHRSEQDLLDREQFLHSIYEGTDLFIFVVEVLQEGEYSFAGWNRTGERLLGITSAEVIGQTPEAVLGVTKGGSLRQHLLDCISAENSINYEECYLIDNAETWWLTTLKPLKDDLGRIYRIIGTAHDISERKQAEIERQNLVSIVDNSSDFIALASAEGKPFYINAAGRKLLGIGSLDETTGLNMFKFFMPDDLERVVLRHIVPAVMDVGSWSGELRLRHFKTGKPIPVDYNIFKIKNRETGETIGLATVCRDITERKRSEEAARRSSTLFQEMAAREALLNRISTLIRNSLELDKILKNVVEQIASLLQIERCWFSWLLRKGESPAWNVVSEVRRPDLPSFLGKTPANLKEPLVAKLFNLEIIHEDDVVMSRVVGMDRMAELGCRALLYLPIQTLSGDIGVIGCASVSGRRHWEAGEVELLGAVCANLAIAINQADLYQQSRESARLALAKSLELERTLMQLQQTQSNLVQAEKMSSLGQMVAGVAHEINNPVSFIYGNLIHAQEYTADILEVIQLYRKAYPKATPEIDDAIDEVDLDYLVEDLPHLLSSMKVGADRIREIVKSLRTFSRLDEAEKKSVDIHENIDSTLMILHHRLKGKANTGGIQIIKSYGQIPEVDCYSGQLNQVFMNLIANAIDALEERDQGLSMAEKRANPSTIEITTALVKDCVRISIADNGPGMKREVISKIFDPFYTTKPVGKGTGLGLSISYQIVERHGGQLRCMSELGHGTEFILEIPVQGSSKIC